MKRSLPILFQVLFQLTFWIWNLLFLTVVYVGLLPFIAPPMFMATVEGQLPLEFSLSVTALIAVPTVASILGIVLRRQPMQLMRLFYGVEAPLLVLCVLRLFLLRELTPASNHILVSLGIAIAAFFVELFAGYARQNRTKAWLQLAAHTLMLLVGIYAGIVLMFYALPLAAYLIQTFFQFGWLGAIWEEICQNFLAGLITTMIWTVLSLLLFFFSCTLFVLMPSMMATLYTHSGLTVIRQFAAQYGRGKTLAGVLGTMTASLVLFLALQQQPQTEALALLQRPAKTDAQRMALLAKSDKIQAGLLNAYLAEYRYVTSETENDHIQRIYQGQFGLSEAAARGVQVSYNRILSPFLYQGSFGEGEQAEKLYEQFFDRSIQKGERDLVNHALQSTWNRDEAKAGLLNFNQQKVWLKSQTVSVKEQGDWAEVELYEVYENQTFDRQEVFYSFSLPETAVITGLWLGDTGDRAKRFPYVVSPRGAAQQVYTEQVRQQVDPALLEQVGPRHYRLRAFPVPPKVSSLERSPSGPSPAPNRPTQMHLWLTYTVMQQPQGWPLPHLGEKRNLFWTNRTERIRNGKADKIQDAWLEAYLPTSQSVSPTAHQTTLADGSQIAAQPLRDQDYVLPKNQRFAIVLDSSHSMGQHLPDLQRTFDWLKQQGFGDRNLANNEADLFITTLSGGTAQRRDLQAFDPAKQVFYGSVRLDQMQQQFTQLRGDTAYDGILLVTDEGSYELAKDKPTLAKLPAPLWMVHLGSLPPAYDDGVLQAIESSGGGVGTDLPDVLRRQATKVALGTATVNVADGYAWTMQPVKPSTGAIAASTSPPNTPTPNTPTPNTPTPNTPTPNTPTTKPKVKPAGFDALAARQFILGFSRQQDMANLANLDRVQAIAQRFHIVSPYSSMIVLVNDAQREALKRAENQGDRFQREVESGKEELSKPFSPLNSAAPEPSTWAGAVVIILGLLGFKWKHRRRLKSPKCV